MIVELDDERYVCIDDKRIAGPLSPGLNSRNLIDGGRFDFVEIVDCWGTVVDLIYVGLTPVNVPRLYVHAAGSYAQ